MSTIFKTIYLKLLNCPCVIVYTSYTLYILFYITFAMSISYVIIMLYCFTFINVTLLYVLSYYRKYVTYYRDIRTVIIIFLMLHASDGWTEDLQQFKEIP